MLIFSSKPIISHLVFLFSISITVLTIIPALFPAIYSSFTSNAQIPRFQQFGYGINSFEPGIFFIPIIVVSILVLAVSIIIKFKSIKLPSIDFPKKYAIISMIIILSLFTILSYEDIFSEDLHEDWKPVKYTVENWPPEVIGFGLHVRFFLLSTSFAIFGNYRVIPFLASAALIITTYLFASKITNNRFAGVIASAIILQSNLFLSFSSTPSYTVFWVMFYLASLYLTVHKTWFLSPFAFILSIFSKPLSATFFPISLFFILDSTISVKKKIILSLTIIIIIIAGTSIIGNHMSSEWDWNGFWNGFVSLSYQMRFDGLIMVFLIPTVIGLYFVSKKIRYANTVSIMISGVLISNPLLLAMTDITSQPYRFIPLVIFFAIGVGMLLTNQKEEKIDKKIKRVSKNSKRR